MPSISIRVIPTAYLVIPALSALGLLVACASQSPDPPTTSPTGVTSDSLTAAAGSTTAIDLLRRGGSFMFSLDESDPAATFRAQCGKESGGDSAKAEACYAHIREEGSHEGMRFALDAQQRVVLTSFGLEDGQEAIYLEGPLSLATDGDRGVLGTFAAVPHGLQMEGKTALPKKPVRFEFVDAKTMVMTDEIKGRLVYHRSGEADAPTRANVNANQ